MFLQESVVEVHGIMSCAGCRNEASDDGDGDEEEKIGKESDSEVSDEDFEDLNNISGGSLYCLAISL